MAGRGRDDDGGQKVPHYERVCLLAQGGMGGVEVALRREGRFHRLYALKRPHAHLQEDPRSREMFMDEARLAGLVRHPNVVSVLDVGDDADGPYLAMEYVEGLSAADVIARLSESGETLPLGIALTVAAHAARGLHAAHELTSDRGEPLGLVHRDVSPQNILVGYDGLARMTDFGIAKALGNLAQTTTGILKGNVGYMSPEYLRFEDVDRRSDVFSLGVVLFELLTGRRLYPSRDGDEAARRILNEPPPAVGEARTDAPPELTALLSRMLAKEKRSRPATAGEVADELEGILRELAPGEGQSDVAGYLARRFVDDRRRQEAAVGEGTRRLRERAPAAPAMTSGASAVRAPGGRAAPIASVAALALGAIVAVAVPGPWRPWRSHGLRGEYFADVELKQKVGERVDPQLHFDWDAEPPLAGMQRSDFSARWTGKLRARYSEPTELCLRHDDGARLWLDGKLLVDDWQHVSRLTCATVDLVAGRKHDLRVEYFQGVGYAVLDLTWESPSIKPSEHVPADALFLR